MEPSSKRRNVVSSLLVLTVVIHLVGFSTDHWSAGTLNGYYVSFGLWKVCVCDTLCQCLSYSESGIDIFFPDYIRIVQALECLGVTVLLVATGLMLYQTLHKANPKYRNIIIGLLTVAGTCIIVGATLFGVKEVPSYLHYSFALCCVSGTLSLVIAAVLYREARKDIQQFPGQVMTTAAPQQLPNLGIQHPQANVVIAPPQFPYAGQQPVVVYQPGANLAYQASAPPPYLGNKR